MLNRCQLDPWGGEGEADSRVGSRGPVPNKPLTALASAKHTTTLAFAAFPSLLLRPEHCNQHVFQSLAAIHGPPPHPHHLLSLHPCFRLLVRLLRTSNKSGGSYQAPEHQHCLCLFNLFLDRLHIQEGRSGTLNGFTRSCEHSANYCGMSFPWSGRIILASSMRRVLSWANNLKSKPLSEPGKAPKLGSANTYPSCICPCSSCTMSTGRCSHFSWSRPKMPLKFALAKNKNARSMVTRHPWDEPNACARNGLRITLLKNLSRWLQGLRKFRWSLHSGNQCLPTQAGMCLWEKGEESCKTTRFLEKDAPEPLGLSNADHAEWIKGGQTILEGLLWLSTRARPDLPFSLVVSTHNLDTRFTFLWFNSALDTLTIFRRAKVCRELCRGWAVCSFHFTEVNAQLWSLLCWWHWVATTLPPSPCWKNRDGAQDVCPSTVNRLDKRCYKTSWHWHMFLLLNKLLTHWPNPKRIWPRRPRTLRVAWVCIDEFPCPFLTFLLAT